jgi:hypothetical protein
MDGRNQRFWHIHQEEEHHVFSNPFPASRRDWPSYGGPLRLLEKRRHSYRLSSDFGFLVWGIEN